MHKGNLYLVREESQGEKLALQTKEAEREKENEAKAQLLKKKILKKRKDSKEKSI